MIAFETLHCNEGDVKLTLQEETPEERKAIAAHVIGLLTQGALIVVKESNGDEFRVVGYNAQTNEWIVLAPPKKHARKSAKGTKATVIAPIAGG